MALSSSPGARNRRIAFHRAEITKDAMNADVQTWPELGKRWACASFGTGQERRDAAQQSGSAPATFRVLLDSLTRTLTITDRIRYLEADWDITSIVPAADERPNTAIDITAIRAA